MVHRRKDEEKESNFNYIYFLPRMGKRTDLAGTAIPGQFVARAVQAPYISPSCKNQRSTHTGLVSDIKLISTNAKVR